MKERQIFVATNVQPQMMTLNRRRRYVFNSEEAELNRLGPWYEPASVNYGIVSPICKASL
jgi:hypothetical protein